MSEVASAAPAGVVGHGDYAVVEEDQDWVLGILAVITAAILAYLLRPAPPPPRSGGGGGGEGGPPRVPTKKRDMTLKELRQYDGTGGKPIYVAVKGKIFNVSSHPSGIELYGGCARSLARCLADCFLARACTHLRGCGCGCG